MNRAIAIIPNEMLLNASPVIKDVRDDEYHGMKIEDFSNFYNLGITSESLGIEKNFYGGMVWQVALTSLGHAVVCFGFPMVVYLPKKFSSGQKKWFLDYKTFFNKHKKTLSIVQVDEFENVLVKYGTEVEIDKFKILYSLIEKEPILESSDLKR